MTTIAPHRARDRDGTNRRHFISRLARRFVAVDAPNAAGGLRRRRTDRGWAHEPTEWDSVLLGKGYVTSTYGPNHHTRRIRVVRARGPGRARGRSRRARRTRARRVSRHPSRPSGSAGRPVEPLRVRPRASWSRRALAFLPLPWFYGSIAASYALDASAATICASCSFGRRRGRTPLRGRRSCSELRAASARVPSSSWRRSRSQPPSARSAPGAVR